MSAIIIKSFDNDEIVMFHDTTTNKKYYLEPIGEKAFIIVAGTYSTLEARNVWKNLTSAGYKRCDYMLQEAGFDKKDMFWSQFGVIKKHEEYKKISIPLPSLSL